MLVGPTATGVAAQDAATPEVTASEIVQTQNDWYVAGEARIEAVLAVQPDTNTARNVLLFTADGMGPNTGYAIRIHEGQRLGGYGDDHMLSWEPLPNLALVRTHATNGQTPDSAPTAAANSISRDSSSPRTARSGASPANEPPPPSSRALPPRTVRLKR